MQISPPVNYSDPHRLILRSRLWPDGDGAEHLRHMADALEHRHCVLLAVDKEGSAAGFAEASRRTHYVDGARASPVTFLEGLHVEPSDRRNGVARSLVAEVVRWAEAQHCSEFASDSPTGIAVAHAVHRAPGFEETERVVCFRRAVGWQDGSGRKT